MTKADLKAKFINPNTNLLVSCAWCGMVCDNDRNWIKMNIKLMHSLTANVTHGICPNCFQSLLYTEKQQEIRLGAL